MAATPDVIAERPVPHDALALDPEREVIRITGALRGQLRDRLHRRGFVLGVSGGVDSAVCAALCVRAVGAERVCALMMPERDASGEGTPRARTLLDTLGVRGHMHDISAPLESLGCYQRRDEAMRRVFPDYGPGWRSKLVIRGGASGAINHFNLVVRSPNGETFEKRLGLDAYLAIVAGTNFKQRLRKVMEYYHADRLNYAVVGTPNRLEYELGFFVKNGDGAADTKPIAHLYKSQVYALAEYLDIPGEIRTAPPSTDTYSLPQGQDEFYFALPYQAMDLALWAFNNRRSPQALASALAITTEHAEHVYHDIEMKRRAAAYLHAPPLLV